MIVPTSSVDAQKLPWASTPDFEQVSPYSAEDEECFREIRDVLM